MNLNSTNPNPLEDNFEDILGKAQRGLGISDETLVQTVGNAALERLRAGEFEETSVRALAPLLGLNADALVAIGRGAWHPGSLHVEGVMQFTTNYLGMKVNAYLVWSKTHAMAFDTGADAGPMLAALAKKNLTLDAVCLTHTHGDHVADLDRLLSESGNPPVFVHRAESFASATSIEHGWTMTAGELRIFAKQTDGHSPGGLSYLVTGLEVPVAIVGDALFAGSMGGAPKAWKHALDVNRATLLTLPPETLLCPGHGPMSTVSKEWKQNPFYAT